jgi:hypothetical protein
MQVFSLHAAMHSEADDRQGLERLCRYLTVQRRTDERVRCNAAAQALKLKTPWHDGATHPVMSPLELTQRLAALMPRPRLTIDALCARRTA